MLALKVIGCAIVGLVIGISLMLSGQDSKDTAVEFTGGSIMIVSIIAVGVGLLIGLVLFIRTIWYS